MSFQTNRNSPMNRALTTFAIAASAPFIASTHAGELFLLGAVPYAYAFDSSANGTVVAGQDNSNYWYWTRDTWVVALEESVPPGQGIGGNPCITSDGAVMTCSTLVDLNGVSKAEATLYNINTVAYDPAVGSRGLHCDRERSGAWGMNPTASFVCGLVWNTCLGATGFVWDSATDTMKLMPAKYVYKPTRANDISDDGTVVAGWNDDPNGWRQACVWVKNSSGNYIATVLTNGLATPTKLSEAGVVSGNGVWLAGEGRSSIDGGAPWRWSPATGYQSLGTQPVAGVGGATAINADGSKILCYMGVAAAIGEGYIWIQGRGYVAMEDYAAEFGVTMPEGVRLALPLSISADELTITGTARGPFGTSPFVLDLRPSGGSCVGDLNGDGSVTGADLGTLLGDWGQATASDIDGNGVVDGADLGRLLGAWGPCP
jgi:uncharacterized membrane protein